MWKKRSVYSTSWLFVSLIIVSNLHGVLYLYKENDTLPAYINCLMVKKMIINTFILFSYLLKMNEKLIKTK